MSVDIPALKEIFFSGIPGSASCFPVTVRADGVVVDRLDIADGDCLAAAGSVFAYRNDESPAELRVRIVKELILNAITSVTVI